MNDPIKLELKRSEPISAVIEHLRKLLKQAESGDLRGFIYVARCTDVYQRGAECVHPIRTFLVFAERTGQGDDVRIGHFIP